MEGGLLFSVQLFAENESVCVCVQLCPVNAGVQWLYYENVRFKCMCVSDFVSRLPFCTCCHVCSFDSFPIFVCSCVFSLFQLLWLCCCCVLLGCLLMLMKKKKKTENQRK